MATHEHPFFSILIPTSGRAELIRMAMESVFAQTYQDFEIVIADMSGSSSARSLADETRDPRVRYVYASEGGLSTWDVAAKNARGEYLMWLDDDNYLLPFALDLFKKAINESGADIVTASHVYYYDDAHPRHYLRQSIGVVPFTGERRPIDLHEALRSLFGFARRGAGTKLPRFHFSATVVRRRVAEEALARLGFVLIPKMPNIHSLQPIVFAFAKSCFFVNRPVVIVGRLGVSMSQIWSTAARKRFARAQFDVKLSPVKGYARINGILENYLRVKELLPDLLGDIPINYAAFAELYLRELFYLDTGSVTAIRNWKNFFSFARTLPEPARGSLLAHARRLVWIAPFVFISRRLRLNHLWRAVYGPLIRLREQGRSPRARIGGTQEFAIPIGVRYRVNSIAALAARLREIMIDETGRDLFPTTQ